MNVLKLDTGSGSSPFFGRITGSFDNTMKINVPSLGKWYKSLAQFQKCLGTTPVLRTSPLECYITYWGWFCHKWSQVFVATWPASFPSENRCSMKGNLYVLEILHLICLLHILSSIYPVSKQMLQCQCSNVTMRIPTLCHLKILSSRRDFISRFKVFLTALVTTMLPKILRKRGAQSVSN